MRLSRRNRNHQLPAGPAGPVPVRREQSYVPTKPTKAVVAAVVTMLGLVGIHVTSGTAQLIVMVGQLVLVVFGVWRARNKPTHPGGGGVGEFL